MLRFSAVVRAALAAIQAGADPQEVAAGLISKP